MVENQVQNKEKQERVIPDFSVKKIVFNPASVKFMDLLADSQVKWKTASESMTIRSLRGSWVNREKTLDLVTNHQIAYKFWWFTERDHQKRIVKGEKRYFDNMVYKCFIIPANTRPISTPSRGTFDFGLHRFETSLKQLSAIEVFSIFDFDQEGYTH